MKDKRGRNK